MPLSNYFEAALLNHVLRSTAFSAPATLYVALYTAAPSDTGGGTEVSGGSYARAAITSGTANWSAPTTAGISDNANQISFPQATANWGNVVAIGIFDAATAGNLLWYGTITSTAVNSGQTASIAAGALDLSLD